jgi:tRNA(fMet)-specific endonuclease VapC
VIESPDTKSNRILVDTNVYSYIFGEREEAKFFLPYFTGKTLAVSFMTVAEIYSGAYKKNWGERSITKLERHLKNYAILPYDFGVCLKWAEINSESEREGHPIETADCWIAACALKYECQLATNNKRHFQHIKGLSLIAPGL